MISRNQLAAFAWMWGWCAVPFCVYAQFKAIDTVISLGGKPSEIIGLDWPKAADGSDAAIMSDLANGTVKVTFPDGQTRPITLNRGLYSFTTAAGNLIEDITILPTYNTTTPA